MRRQDLAGADIEALRGVLTAAAALLDRLRTAGTPTERAALGADFDETVMRLRDDLIRRTGCDAAKADARVARALAEVAEQVARDSAEG